MHRGQHGQGQGDKEKNVPEHLHGKYSHTRVQCSE
jgi:hypothetical protein